MVRLWLACSRCLLTVEIRKLNSEPFDVPRATLAQLQCTSASHQVTSYCYVPCIANVKISTHSLTWAFRKLSYWWVILSCLRCWCIFGRSGSGFNESQIRDPRIELSHHWETFTLELQGLNTQLRYLTSTKGSVLLFSYLGFHISSFVTCTWLDCFIIFPFVLFSILVSARTSSLPLSSSFRETHFRTTRYLLWSKLIATQVISTLNFHLNKSFVILSKHALNRITVTDWLLHYPSSHIMIHFFSSSWDVQRNTSNWVLSDFERCVSARLSIQWWWHEVSSLIPGVLTLRNEGYIESTQYD